ncbi:hypothetical protein [Deinococcus radiophilus]|uniref:hypothetical protein n=1 Tax=Deinococcus radiophilus TaxID=32062 RepID=UPI001474F39E|nr:hypothetical protein [Deinococcus radiophilus]UFA50588.1 hypothetical protein LMT64_01345 [Deinococcus radiophilus]
MSPRRQRTRREPPRDRYEQQRERNGRFWKTNLLIDAVMAVFVAVMRVLGR